MSTYLEWWFCCSATPRDPASRAELYESAWWNVEDVVIDPVAAENMKKSQEEELSSKETEIKVLKAMLLGESPVEEGLALVVMGPSGSGKSWFLTETRGKAASVGEIAVPNGAMHVDGAIIREQSTGWKENTRMARDNGLDGFTNYFKDYFKKPMDKLKGKLIDDAIGRKQNIVIPDTASDISKLCALAERLAKEGYKDEWVVIYASKEVCEKRGKSRELAEGKRYSSANWVKSIKAVQDIQEKLDELGRGAQVKILDNSDPDKGLQPITLQNLIDQGVMEDSPVNETSPVEDAVMKDASVNETSPVEESVMKDSPVNEAAPVEEAVMEDSPVNGVI